MTFKTILKDFLKIDSGTHGKPILPSELLKRFENAWNKHFWSDVFSKNFLNAELLELSLLTRATQGDNKKIFQIDFWLMAYFLKKSILSVHSGEKPAKSIIFKAIFSFILMDLADFSQPWTLKIDFFKK